MSFVAGVGRPNIFFKCIRTNIVSWSAHTGQDQGQLAKGALAHPGATVSLGAHGALALRALQGAPGALAASDAMGARSLCVTSVHLVGQVDREQGPSFDSKVL